MPQGVGGARFRVRASSHADAQTLVLLAVLAAIGLAFASTATPAPPAGAALAAATGSTQDWSNSRDLRSLQAPATVPVTTPRSAPAPHPRAASHAGPPPPRQPAPPPPPPPSSSSSAASAVFAAINQSRAAAGLAALRWSSGLSRSAHLHDLAMAAADQLSHQVSGEAPLASRVSQQGVPWSWVGENIGESPWLSTAGALGLEQLMMGDSAHRQDILTTSGTMVGVDVVFDTGHHTLWLTEDFAN